MPSSRRPLKLTNKRISIRRRKKNFVWSEEEEEVEGKGEDEGESVLCMVCENVVCLCVLRCQALSI